MGKSKREKDIEDCKMKIKDSPHLPIIYIPEPNEGKRCAIFCAVTAEATKEQIIELLGGVPLGAMGLTLKPHDIGSMEKIYIDEFDIPIMTPFELSAFFANTKNWPKADYTLLVRKMNARLRRANSLYRGIYQGIF